MANMGAYKGVEIPVGSSQEQIQKIIRDTDASGSGSGELNGGGDAPGSTVNQNESATRINQFGAALNKAIDEGRKQRKDKTLDFMNGVVPPGALPASSFAGVLSAFNSDSAPLETTIMSSAMDFAKDQEQVKEDARNNIRDLALAVGKNGGSQETVNAITALIASGDIDAAIKVGATALHEWEQIGSNIIMRNPDGSAKVIWSDPDGGDSPTKAEQEDSTVSAAEQVMIDNRGIDGKTNPAIYLDFYNEWIMQQKPEADFFKLFPPDNWLSYADQTIPAYIRNQMKAPKEETKEETKKTEPVFGTDEYYDSLLQ